MRDGRRSTPVERRISFATAMIAVAAVLLALEVGWRSPPWWSLPVLAVAIALAEATSVRMVIGRQGWSFSLTDAVLAVGFLLAPGAWIPLGIVAGVSLAQARRVPGLKVAFNAAPRSVGTLNFPRSS